MIYTCYEMIRDCRAGEPAGWTWFAANYVPVIRRLLRHYSPPAGDDTARTGRLLAALKAGGGLFEDLEPVPERIFLTVLRQRLLDAVERDQPFPPPAIPLDPEALSAALAELTLAEKQAVWLETMRYGAAEAAVMLRMDPATAERIRHKADDRIRAAVDSWSDSLLASNGIALGRSAATGKGPDCLPAKAYLDIIDGRTTWRGREEVDRHAGGCLHCLDHFCRMLEAVDLLRGNSPLSTAEAAPWLEPLGVGKGNPQRRGWKRVFGAA